MDLARNQGFVPNVAKSRQLVSSAGKRVRCERQETAAVGVGYGVPLSMASVVFFVSLSMVVLLAMSVGGTSFGDVETLNSRLSDLDVWQAMQTLCGSAATRF